MNDRQIRKSLTH